MRDRRRSRWAHTAWLGLAAGLALILTGDQGAQSSTIIGIDPLEVMNSRVKPNIMILLDTSGSMKWSVHQDLVSVGADDPVSRMAIVKKALGNALTIYQGQANFGLATFEAPDVSKTLSGSNNPRQDFDGDGRFDGPVIYATTDLNGAYWAGRFNTVSDSSILYTLNPTLSFMNTTPFDAGQPAGCVAGVDCAYYIQSRFLRNTGSLFLFDTTVTPPVFVSETPGAFPNNCFAFEDGGGNNAVYCYQSTIFRLPSSASTGCGSPTAAATPVAACTADSVPDIKLHLRPEMSLDVNGNPANVAGAPTVIEEANPPVVGIRADQATSLDAALTGAATLLPSPLGAQKDYILLITDNLSPASLTEGPTINHPCGGTDQDRVFAAAAVAQNLFNGPKKIETLVVALGSATAGVGVDRANIIAHAGTGEPANPALCTPSDPTARCKDAFIAESHSDPAEIQTELEGAIGSALDRAMWGGTYSAAQPILASVFELGRGASPLSGVLVDPLDPRTRYDQRVNILYQSTFDVPGFRGHLLGFRNDGTFQPIGNNNTKGYFEVGETMFEKTSQAPQGLEDKVGRNGNLDEYVFEELHNGATVDDIDQAPGTGALLKRRIFTSPGNGDFQSGRSAVFGPAGGYDSSAPNGRNVVALWPPNQTGLKAQGADVDPVDPNLGATVATGVSLDDALGIGPGSSPVLSYNDLKARFGACDRSDDLSQGPQVLPAECDPIDPVLSLNFARKEAREIILAHMVGARVKRSQNDGKPMRAPVGAPTDPPGTLFFEDRGWTFPDTTLSTPAVVTPPLRSTPDRHVAEFVLFRDGRRDENREGINEVDLGFGLRNPDFDDAAPETKLTLKPIMTVIYIGAQDMLHAFRAGPNCAVSPPPNPTACAEQGGEELWAFVPFDLLKKQKDMIPRNEFADPNSRGYTIRGPNLPVVDPDPLNPPNDRDHHTYGVASSIRVADIFVPGSFTPPPPIGATAVTFAGRWRTVLFFGRGPGGKFYTALDVTAPGPFTRNALKTNAPWVMWNQGNEDDVVDAYDRMGETWSVPAVGNVAGTPEWVAFVGSGYGNGINAAAEGSTFYMLNALTGVPTSVATTDGSGQTFPCSAAVSPTCALGFMDVGDGTPTYMANNALVASPAGWNGFQLDDPTLPTRSADKVTRVFIPDLHGRIWKFPVGSWGQFGPTQPFANAMALLKTPDNAHELVFAESGNDPRVPLGLTPPFRVYGFEDKNAGNVNGSGAAAAIPGSTFPVDLVNGSNRFRGTVQPTTGFASDPSLGTVGRVFFAGTRYIPDLTGNGCASTFETLLFAFGALSGGAAYDFTGNTNVTAGGQGFATLLGNRTTGIQVVGGQVIVGQSGGIAGSGTSAQPPGPPPPPGAGMPPPAPPTPPYLITLAIKPSSAVCRSQ